MMKIIAEVNLDKTYLLLRRHMADVPADKAEQYLTEELKRIFIIQGIRFYDRPGLYPVKPSLYSSTRANGNLIITIKKGISDD